METTSTISTSLRVSPAWLKGRIIGALILGSFGAIWTFEAVYFGGIATPVLVTVIAIFAVASIAWPATRLYSLPRMASVPADRLRWASIAKTYWTIVATEWLLCAGAANWLARHHRYHLIPVFLGVIIGVHFLPLARLFKMPIYYATGIFMVLGVLAALAIPAGEARNIVTYGVNGLCLWLTAVVILCQDWLSSRDREVIPLAG
jgi:hypothetical protein